MAVLASRLLALPSLARSQRELTSDVRSLARKGSSPRTLGRSLAKGACLRRSALSLSLSSWHWIDDGLLVPVVPPSRAPFEAM
jgi:hypothetical protein